MKFTFKFALLLSSLLTTAQAPNPALIGYWQNWNDANSSYIQLDQIDSRYNLIEVSFAVPQAGTDYKMEFIPDQVSQSALITQIQNLQSQGKKVLISIGGATAPVSLDNISERDTFGATMNAIIISASSFSDSKHMMINCNQLSWLIPLTSTRCLLYVLLCRIHSYYFVVNSSTLDFASK